MNTNSFHLSLPISGEHKVVLHVCCAPCSCSILERMIKSGIEPTVFFYNPNIYPREEYEHRKQEVVRFAQKKNIPFVDSDCDSEVWFETVRGHEEAAERGERCALCFQMRLGKTAAYAAEHGFKIFATSLGISRWKDLEQVNHAGRRAASLFPGLVFWDHNWRLQGGQEQMEQIIKEENIYRQNYCGCLYSLRESIKRNLAKQSRGA